MKSLTQNQELYVQARTRGLTQRAAYREAYPNSAGWQDSAVDSAASRLENNSKVSARLEDLNKQAAKQAKLSKKRLLNRLDELAEKANDTLTYIDIEGNDRIRIGNAEIMVKATRELLPFAQDDEDEDDREFVVDFGLILAPSFLRPHRLIANCAQTDFWCGGGRGSMKSSFVSLEIINDIEKNPDHNALVMQKYKADIKDASYAQIRWAIDMLGLTDEYDCPESTLRITKRSTGQRIIFKGCDKAERTKSAKVTVGYIAILWLEEADMFDGMAEVRRIRQSVTRGGEVFLRFYTFNPPRSKTCWINEYMEQIEAAGQEVFRSTYLDAPAEWLGQAFIDDAEELKRIDMQAYEHEYLGLPVGLGGDVFDRVVFREITDKEIEAFDNIRCGQDFGWYPDPWAFTMSEWQPNNRTILTYFEDGGNKLQPNEQAERIIKALVWRDDPNQDPVYHHLPVYSDDADPTAIAAQRDTGANARAAGKGSMRAASYRFVQSCTWVIDPARCPRLAKEVREMQYERSKSGEWLNTIPDGNDHWVDSIRYAFMREARSRAAYREATQD